MSCPRTQRRAPERGRTPGSFDPESSALTIRPLRFPQVFITLKENLDLLEFFQVCSVAKAVIRPPVEGNEGTRESADVREICFVYTQRKGN